MKTTDEINEHLHLSQHTEGLRFGTDAYLLAAYFRGGKNKRVCDLGSGTGVLSLLLLAKEKCSRVTALEIQEKYASLCRENAEKNGFADRMETLCEDVRTWDGGGAYDAVITNPPYFPVGHGLVSASREEDLARREYCGTIRDFTASASRALRHGGAFLCVYPADRIADLFSAMRDAKLEPKRLTWVCPTAMQRPSLLLTEGKKGAAPGCFVTRPLLLADAAGAESADCREIYEKGRFPHDFDRP